MYRNYSEREIESEWKISGCRYEAQHHLKCSNYVRDAYQHETTAHFYFSLSLSFCFCVLNVSGLTTTLCEVDVDIAAAAVALASILQLSEDVAIVTNAML